MFRPLQGHLQGARKPHSLNIQCFCLLSQSVSDVNIFWLKLFKFADLFKPYGCNCLLFLFGVTKVISWFCLLGTDKFYSRQKHWMWNECGLRAPWRWPCKGRNMCRGWRIRNIKWKYSEFRWSVICETHIQLAKYATNYLHILSSPTCFGKCSPSPSSGRPSHKGIYTSIKLSYISCIYELRIFDDA
jgi:hypothetical protein